eukprot:2435-Pelagococcus_subviridis.AAC.17
MFQLLSVDRRECIAASKYFQGPLSLVVVASALSYEASRCLCMALYLSALNMHFSASSVWEVYISPRQTYPYVATLNFCRIGWLFYIFKLRAAA